MHLRVPASGMLTDRSIWDSLGPEGEGIVALAKSVVALDNSIATLGNLIFSFDVSIVRPLYSRPKMPRSFCLTQFDCSP
jgi:hypothetical protein